jgi:replicative superfamily II helicase
MVDFNKLLKKKPDKRLIDPIELYETLDRASDKGELRKAQSAILTEWHKSVRAQRDVIVKLHTGQGKTLIGLMILLSKLNETGEPVVYLCPNNHLVAQTCEQAKEFGVPYIMAEDDLPDEFNSGKRLLITSVQKLFNGLSKFGLRAKSLNVSTILMDDAHACVDAVRDACAIRLARDEQPYAELLDLFQADLEEQGAGTLADIRNEKYDAILPVPYWAWADRVSEVVRLLSKHTDKKSVKFARPLLKNILSNCQCIISGDSLEISANLPPLQLFGTYDKAKHRVFMSATDADDAFLIKGLRLKADTVAKPLVYKHERWSGEKMILIPSLIDDSLDREALVNALAKPVKDRKYGVVALTPSFKDGEFWEKCGASVAKRESINEQVEALKAGGYEKPLVIVNRYDGIDLPDRSCRLLIFDSLPHFESLLDRYMESCLGESDIIAKKAARKVEQGLGRSVRGEKDYSAIILTGPQLIKLIRSNASRRHFSPQTQSQIELGLEIAELAREEIAKGEEPMKSLWTLVNQCLKRDAGWKGAYVERMNALKPDRTEKKGLNLFESELIAEQKYQAGDADGAMAVIQELIDTHKPDVAQKGWYLQEIARYLYGSKRIDSNQYQIEAHKKNPYLLKPQKGMQVITLQPISQKRAEAIIDFVRAAGTYEQLAIIVGDILSNLAFGVKADKFEKAFDDLSRALGFQGERPDKAWKEGPDNLWALRDGEYLLVECKSEVALGRAEINKDESGQMIKASAWFAKHYKGVKVKRILIIPTLKVGKAAAFTDEVEVMRDKSLTKLRRNVKAFFQEFESLDLGNISEGKVQKLLNAHSLGTDSITSEYSEKVKVF